MAWVRCIDPEDAVGRLREVYDHVQRRRGHIPNVARVQSLRPEVMDIGFSMYCRLMDDRTGLSFRERILVAIVVSKENGCHY